MLKLILAYEVPLVILVLTTHNIQSLFLTMNNELDILTDWFRANKLSLNDVSKTNCMLFTNSNHNKTYCLQLAGQQITQSQCVKFLGMHIDNCLKWDKHIKKDEAED